MFGLPTMAPPPGWDPSEDPKGVPPELQQQLRELEQWASGNKKDARRDSLLFWMFKVPAILGSALAGVWAQFGLTTVSVLFGAVASICVIIDGIHPRGMLRNTHLRAFHDLRILQNRMKAEWRSRSPRSNDDTVARQIIHDAEKDWQKIAAAIRDAETALQVKGKI